MNKKICAAALAGALALITLGLTGCGDGNTAESTEKAASFTYWLPVDANIATRVQTYNEVEMYKQREKDSGNNIEFIHPSLGPEAAQINLMDASRDLPE